MTSISKRAATLSAFAIMLIGSAAQAAIIAPAPPRDPFATGHDRGGCYKPDQVAANTAISVKDAGYIDTFRWTYFAESSKVQAFGVKKNNVWFSFIVENCRGSIVLQEKLKGGKPGFIN